MSDFLIRALLAGLMVAAIAGPLGCLVLWRRMAFFGDALSHSALLGIALGFLLSIAPLFGVLGAVVVLALLFASLQESMSLAMDTLLSLIAHSALAVGMVVLSLMPGLRFDLNAYLFGDILAVGSSDLWLMAGATVLVLGALALLWRSLVAVSVHPEIAAAEGISLKLS
ncbi:MAG: metal ABC transporter permease, partial [Parvibaculaceae bacterium]|nr:metal ABC transporter permease [Parvibaculaceae bacterium]